MSNFYSTGQHVIGADVLPAVRRVQSRNAGLWAANMMSAENKPPAEAGTKGDLLLQIGDEVSVIGPAAKNEYNVSFTPISLAGKDGVYWIRTTDLGTTANYAKSAVKPTAMPVAAAETGWPWWKYALVIGGGVVVAGGAAILIGRASKASKRGQGHVLNFRRA